MRLALIALGLAVLFAIPFFIWGASFEENFSTRSAVTWLESWGVWSWAAAVGLLVADIVLPLPATGVMFALGYVYGPLVGGLVGATGSFLSGSLAYGGCRMLGRRTTVFLVGERDLVRGQRIFAEFGGWAVALSRWMPLLPEVMACTAGLLKMAPAPFFTALACGSIPMAFTFSTMGYLGTERPVFALLLSVAAAALLWLIASLGLYVLGRRTPGANR